MRVETVPFKCLVSHGCLGLKKSTLSGTFLIPMRP